MYKDIYIYRRAEKDVISMKEIIRLKRNCSAGSSIYEIQNNAICDIRNH